MVEFITGASGSGKSTEMINRINKASDEEREICIIVPEQFSYEFDKKLYKSIGAMKFNKLLSLTFTGLARHLFQIYGDKRRSGKYADETARMILIYQALKALSSNPQSNRYFEKQISRPGFAEDVLKLVEELKKSGITPERLIEKSVMLDKKLMDKTSDVAMVYLEYERLMKEYGFKDSFDDIKVAAEIAGFNRFFDGMSVYIDEFESFTGDQLELLRVIIAAAENVTVALRTEDVNAGEFTLFETVNATYRSLVNICREQNKEIRTIVCDKLYRFSTADTAYLSANIMRSSKPKTAPPTPENITIFEAKDYYGEAEYICATIKHLIYRDRTLKFSDIAVISNKIEQYAAVLEAAFERYEIPYFLSIEKPVMHTSVMIFLSTLVDIVSKKKFSSELLFRFMKCGLLELPLTEVSKLENYCYKWGIDGDLWCSSFTAHDDDIELIENLRKSVIIPLEKLRKSLAGKCTAEKLCRVIYDFITQCGAEKRISSMMNTLIAENKDYEASELKRLWACLTDILDSIFETLGTKEITASEAGRLIKSLIGRISYSVPPQKLDSVTAASARTARLNAPRIVFVMGANDGDFPNTVNVHGIYSESDKQKLSDNGIEISRRLPELIASERLVVYKSLSSASEKVYITYPLIDLSGESKYPAQAIDFVTELFGDKSILFSESAFDSGYYSVTMKSAFYRYMQDRKRKDASSDAVEALLLEDFDYRRRIMYVAERSGKKISNRISTDRMEKLKNFNPLRISPSGFETYSQCHFQYFCGECLKLYLREKIDLDSRFSGNIIHNCFYNIISSHSKEDFLKLSYSELEEKIRASAEQYLNKEMGGEFAKTPRFEFAYKKLSERLVKVFVHTQQELMASSFEPAAYEINLRDENNRHSLRLTTPNGVKLSFGGVIDRADVCRINGSDYVRIIDYKSKRLELNARTLSNGINMQMLLYLFAITGEKGIFSGHRPAGVLYAPVEIPSPDSDETKIETENISALNSSLKTNGLVLSKRDVLEAMEHGIAGKYVPVRLTKTNGIDGRSHCITADGFNRLRDYSYIKLEEMADELHSGNVEANPLVFSSQKMPCGYCAYSDMCDNSPLIRYRDAKETDVSEAEEILNIKKEEEAENGVD